MDLNSPNKIPADLYQRLECPELCSRETLRQKHRELTLKYHPDRAGVQSTRKMQEINEIYDFLTKNKEQYDQALMNQRILRRQPTQPSYARPTQDMEEIFNIIINGMGAHMRGGFYWTTNSAGGTTSSGTSV
jgi:DnaJ-class molecular chaperone